MPGLRAYNYTDQLFDPCQIPDQPAPRRFSPVHPPQHNMHNQDDLLKAEKISCESHRWHLDYEKYARPPSESGYLAQQRREEPA